MSLVFSSFHNRRDRRLWCKERSNHFWARTVQYVFKGSDWLENFRMSKETFDYLCNKLRDYIGKKSTNMRRPISVEERVAVTLWFLSTGSGFRSVAWLFGISKSSVSIIVRETCDAIVNVLQRKFIKIPSGEMLNQVIDGFEQKWGFPQCAGAIDGSHIPVTSPSEYRTDFYNRKGSYSIILQGLVDDKYRFTDIYVGWPGRVHDAHVFRKSGLFAKASSGILLPEITKDIEGVRVPLVIVGDAAYPLMPWLMKPFINNRRLDEEQKHFNYRQSRARMVVENAFGRLKGRWRVLLKRMEIGIKSVPNVISACCVLHNMCEIWGEVFQDEWLEEVPINNRIPRRRVVPRDAARDRLSKRIRDAIKTWLQRNN